MSVFLKKFVKGTTQLSGVVGTILMFSVAPTAIGAVQDTAVGHYQSRNVRWHIAPKSNTFLNREAMHFSSYSHSEDENFMSTSFFPQQDLQISDLTQLDFNVLYPYGSNCTSGSLRMVVMVAKADGSEESPVIIYPTAPHMATPCVKNHWIPLDFVKNSTSTWASNNIPGGTNFTNKAGAHDDVTAAFGADYRISVIRINGDAQGPEMWIHNQVINGLTFRRAQDFSQNALLPDVALVPSAVEPSIATDAIGTYGFFETKGVRWTHSVPVAAGMIDRSGLHYADHTHGHGSDENFMSVSFFPQNTLQIPDLKQLAVDMMFEYGTKCKVSGVRFNMDIVDENEEVAGQVNVVMQNAHNTCKGKYWRNLDFTKGSQGDGYRWETTQIGGVISSNQAGAHAEAVANVGANYRVGAIRLQLIEPFSASPKGAEAWFHGLIINGFRLLRLNDFTENAVYPDSALFPAE